MGGFCRGVGGEVEVCPFVSFLWIDRCEGRGGMVTMGLVIEGGSTLTGSSNTVRKR